MAYRVKEIFLTLQGEGGQTGRRAVFCRFAGCNLWTGLEQDRAKAVCQFCDTQFRGGRRYVSAEALADAIAAAWGEGRHRLVVFTGGEPALQLDDALTLAVRDRGFSTAIETNGTLPLPRHLDWICVSPKAGPPLKVTDGDELKVVWPQPLDLDSLAKMPFRLRYLQPMAGKRGALRACVDRCLADSRWRLSLQTHKMIGIA